MIINNSGALNSMFMKIMFCVNCEGIDDWQIVENSF